MKLLLVLTAALVVASAQDTLAPTPLATPSPTPHIVVVAPEIDPLPGATAFPSPAPTPAPTTPFPTATPTPFPTTTPTPSPTPAPTPTPTPAPSFSPTPPPTLQPTPYPTPEPTAEPPTYVSLNLTFTISNVDMTAAEFSADYNAQAVVKDALTISVAIIRRQDILRIWAAPGYTATVLKVSVQVTKLLQDSGYLTSTELFDAVVSQSADAVKTGNLARNLQKAADINDSPGLAATTVDAFTAPSTYAVNGIKTSGARPTESHEGSDTTLPTSIVAPAVVGGLAVFAGIYYYSRVRAGNFRRESAAAVEAPPATGV